MATEEQTIIQREAPEVEALKLGLIRAAKGLVETAPTGGLPQTQFADYDPFQDQARNLATAAIGSFAPYLSDAFAGNQEAANRLKNQVTKAYQDALASYSDADRDALLNTMGGRITTALGTPTGTDGILGAIRRGETATGNVRANIFGTPGIAGSGVLSATDAAKTAQEEAVRKAREAGTFGKVQAQAAINALAGTGGAFDPSATTGGVSTFLNPFTSAVIDQSLADLQRASDIAALREDAQAAQAGAFGGSRAGIVQAERDRNLLDAQARIAAQLRQQGYGQALQQAQQAFEAGKGRQQQLAQLTGQLGQAGAATQLSAEELAQRGALGTGQLRLQGGQLGLSAEELALREAAQQGSLASEAARLGLSEAELRAQVGLQGAQLGLQGAQGLQSVANDIGRQAAQRAALAELQSGLQRQDVDMMNQLGQQRFQTEQAKLDAQQQDQLAEVYEPYQRLGFYSDILRGAPSTQMSISQASTPNPSLLNQVVGGAATGLGLAGAASKIF
jgi:hypothetical protein